MLKSTSASEGWLVRMGWLLLGWGESKGRGGRRCCVMPGNYPIDFIRMSSLKTGKILKLKRREVIEFDWICSQVFVYFALV